MSAERKSAPGTLLLDLPLPGTGAAPPAVARRPDVSVVVPLTDPPQPLPELYREYAAPLRSAGYTYEFLIVGGDANAEELRALGALAGSGEPIRFLLTGHGLAESALLKLAAARAQGEIIVTLPPVRRVEAEALPRLVKAVEAGADLAVARRWPRRDSLVNRVQTRVVDWLIGRLLTRPVNDMGCGVRAIRSAVLRDLPLHGEGHRFMPLVAMREGYQVREIEAPQHGRTRTRVYTPLQYLRRLVDLLGLVFVLRFTDKPLRFFGLFGSVLSAVGGAILLVLFVQRLGGQPIADRPLLVLGVLIFTVGVQAFALGLIGEIIVHLNAPRQKPYRVREPREAPPPE